MAFPNIAAAVRFDIEYKSVKGLSLELTVWAPTAGQADAAGLSALSRCPACINFHPGGLTGGIRTDWLPEYLIDEALGQGIVCATVEYRLLPRTPAVEILQDATDAYFFVRDKLSDELLARGLPCIDPQRVGVSGLSGGGWCAATLGGLDIGVKAVFGIYGMVGVDSPYYNTVRPEATIFGIPPLPPPSDFARLSQLPELAGLPLIDFSKTREEYEKMGQNALDHYDQIVFSIHLIQYGCYANQITGTDGLSEKLSEPDLEKRKAIVPSNLHKLFPLLNIGPNYPLTALLHGTLDDGVPIEDSDNWKAQLDKVGAPNKLVRVPDAKHGFEVGLKNSNDEPLWHDYVSKAVGFFLKHLKE
ncbi:alpha/beta-hydrolase [Calocera viscosa TUFC12733]|uniref:Alpha/beta-hydrolase n=1 Tax=Calocera viscosa (strain TUFC12733) TaxID=1330018 RepID=A0A167HB50_CALVF|nr:alpha/beta-hydrolase [Calocera viscosa TUFC12733]